ncbi:hypothetical protein SAMN05443575_1478 [Jatrophihabitans endophyticus]|uniref:Uncharacterized protein n=1 Tax=Jatrophihabitans endophyticus TaxID=1206085 RepID=A0A1M5HCV7_9ACTN|nr:hypothetical protein [Jatrophihabitans endophyticus]SHG13767.1 hypothetical protein SAMN05443575_1478 [Jatrophihabitans endophyticus]
MLFFTRRVAGVRFYSDLPPADVPRLSRRERFAMGEREVDRRVARWLVERGRRKELVRVSTTSLATLAEHAEVLRRAHAATARARRGMAVALVCRGESAVAVWEESGVPARTFRSWLYVGHGKPTERLLIPEAELHAFDEHQNRLAHQTALEAMDFDVLRLKSRRIRTAGDRRFNELLEQFTEMHRDWSADNEDPYVYQGIGTEELDVIRDQLAGILYDEALTRFQL